jgi:hypothetical protein
MARYTHTDDGERRTSGLRVQLTPSERAALETAAHEAGAPLSRFVRSCCFRRVGIVEREAGTRRHPEAKKLVYELSAIGNNLNQMTRVANTTGSLAEAAHLEALIALLKASIDHVMAL